MHDPDAQNRGGNVLVGTTMAKQKPGCVFRRS